MWITDTWKDYEVLDTGDGEKLERWGDYLLIRPDPQVIWHAPRKDREWKHPNGHYHRSSKGGGSWEFFDLPEQWDIRYDLAIGKTLTFRLKPFQFKHAYCLTDRRSADSQPVGKVYLHKPLSGFKFSL